MEVQVLRMMGRGLARTRIAHLLHRSAKTVDTHRAAIMKKLDIHDRTELALFAARGLAISYQPSAFSQWERATRTHQSQARI